MNLSTKVTLKDYCTSALTIAKTDLKDLKSLQIEAKTEKIVNFQVFPDSAHQAELKKYQSHLRVDNKFLFHGAHERITYDLHDKNWIPHIEINNPSNCKANTKIKGYQEKTFFDWKIQLEKVQQTRNLKDDAIIYPGNTHLQKLPGILRSSYTHTSNNLLVPRRHLYHISSSKNIR